VAVRLRLATVSPAALVSARLEVSVPLARVVLPFKFNVLPCGPVKVPVSVKPVSVRVRSVASQAA
jgi:hypothetical protein